MVKNEWLKASIPKKGALPELLIPKVRSVWSRWVNLLIILRRIKQYWTLPKAYPVPSFRKSFKRIRISNSLFLMSRLRSQWKMPGTAFLRASTINSPNHLDSVQLMASSTIQWLKAPQTKGLRHITPRIQLCRIGGKRVKWQQIHWLHNKRVQLRDHLAEISPFSDNKKVTSSLYVHHSLLYNKD